MAADVSDIEDLIMNLSDTRDWIAGNTYTFRAPKYYYGTGKNDAGYSWVFTQCGLMVKDAGTSSLLYSSGEPAFPPGRVLVKDTEANRQIFDDFDSTAAHGIALSDYPFSTVTISAWSGLGTYPGPPSYGWPAAGQTLHPAGNESSLGYFDYSVELPSSFPAGDYLLVFIWRSTEKLLQSSIDSNYFLYLPITVQAADYQFPSTPPTASSPFVADRPDDYDEDATWVPGEWNGAVYTPPTWGDPGDGNLVASGGGRWNQQAIFVGNNKIYFEPLT